jgi:hypothetical protein
MIALTPLWHHNRNMPLRIVATIALVAVLAWPCSVVFSKGNYHKNRRSDTPLFRFEARGKAGFINAAGKIVIPPKFDVGWFSEEDFVEGLSPARVGENWGFIDVTGEWAIQPQYWRVQPFSEGLAAVTYRLKGYDFKEAYIDKRGKAVIEFPKGVAEAGPFSEGLAAIRTSGYASVGKLGYVDRSGTVAIPYQFAEGGSFHEGLAAVVLDGQCYIEARDGGSRGTPPSVPAATSCGGVPSFITKRCKEGFIDRTGKVKFTFDSTRDFSEGLAAVEKDSNWGFIDPTGKFRQEPRFEALRSYSNGLAAAKIDGKWGYVNLEGTWAIQPQYLNADDFSDELALTDKGYIDKAGVRVASAQNGTAFVQGLAQITLGDGELGYLNHAGKIVFRYRPENSNPSMLPYSGH